MAIKLDLPRYWIISINLVHHWHQGYVVLLTVDIKRKVGPAVVQVNLVESYIDRFDLAHGTRCRPQFLQISHQLDESSNKGDGEGTSKTAVLTVAEGVDFRTPAVWVELLGIGNVFRIPGSVALFFSSVNKR